MTEARFAAVDLATLGPIATVPLAGAAPRIAFGDVHDGPQPEIAVQVGGEVRIVNLDGDAVTTFASPQMALSLVADTNGDEKDDLVFGGTGSTAASIAIFNGLGQQLVDAQLDSTVFGDIEPIAIREGLLYFTSVSASRTAPGVVAALDIATQQPAWVHTLGPAATGLSISADGYLAVSNRALNRGWREGDAEYDANQMRHHTLVLSPAGEVTVDVPFGAPAKNGFINPGSYSGATNEIIGITGDGGSADRGVVAQLLERVSDLYPGPGSIRVLSIEGEVLAERNGPGESDGTLVGYRVGDALRIAVYWGRAGLLHLFDAHLDLLAETQVGLPPARGTLLQVGNFDGDDEIEHLVADRNRIVVVSESGAIEFETVLPNTVLDGRFVAADEGVPRLVVLTREVTIFAPQPAESNTEVSGSGSESPTTGTLRVFTTPPGADLTIDGNRVDDIAAPRIFMLPEGDHTITASIPGYETRQQSFRVATGRVTTIDLRLTPTDPAPSIPDGGAQLDGKPLQPPHSPGAVPEVTTPLVPLQAYGDLQPSLFTSVPDGYSLREVGDFAGDDGRDILFVARDGLGYLVLSRHLEPIIAGELPVPSYAALYAYDDLDGDGKGDFGGRDSSGPTSLYAITADGRIVMDKSFCYGIDTHVTYSARTESQLLATITTGYHLSPRGAYGLRIGDWTTEFFYPTAGMVNRVAVRNDVYYTDLYTASNGAVVIHDDGYTETDAAIHAHVFDTAGVATPGSQPLGEEPQAGMLRPFFFRAATDDAPVPHYILGKDRYYPGDGGLFRADATIRRVFTAGRDQAFVAIDLLKGESDKLSVVWSPGNIHQIIGDRYEVIYEHAYGETRPFVTAVNLDGDDRWEIVERLGDGIAIRDLERNVLAEFTLPSERIHGVRFVDVTGDGRCELILAGSTEVALFAY